MLNESGQPEPEVVSAAFDGDAYPPRLTGNRYPASKAGAGALRWRRDGRELFILLSRPGRRKVRAFPVRLPGGEPQLGAPRPLFASPDGRRLLIPMADPAKEGASIVVVRNWDAAPNQ